MSKNRDFSLFRARSSERGQALPLLLVVWVVFVIAMAALVVDVGNVYASYRQLQAATDAAALAGAEGLSVTNSAALTNASLYSALSGKKNFYGDLQNVTMVSGYPKLNCSATLSNAGLGCVASSGIYNEILVKQQASVPLYFASVLGVHSMQIATQSTASMRGANPGPFNVIIIVDTTRSMTDDDGGDCGLERIQCALQGVAVLLQGLAPCQPGASCTYSTDPQVATNPVDEVGLMIFPGVAPTTTTSHGVTTTLDPVQDTLLSASGPWQHPYEWDTHANTPTSSLVYTSYGTPLSGTPLSASQLALYEQEYQLVGLSSDYRPSDTNTVLNIFGSAHPSPIAETITNPVNGQTQQIIGGGSGNPGMSVIGGEGTFYAGVIYAAQAELTARARPGAQNVIILLSDGEANATSGDMNTTGSSPIVPATGNGTYPSYAQDCAQGVTAAAFAKSQGTTIYAVAYGSSTSTSDCSTDSHPTITPCDAMLDIATSASTFYSDTSATQGSGACVSSANQGSNTLNKIFGSILSALQVSRLVPNGT